MPVVNRIAAMSDEITRWRRDFHTRPELLYDVHETAKTVKAMLESFGCDEVVAGLGKTGVVGIIRGKTNRSGKVMGLRADMDALPLEEITGLPWASKVKGKMHACGHDGHTAMLLGAAKYLAETRNFDGTAVMIFQPAEEGGAGAKAMVDDGLLERWGINSVWGMHNMPGLPVGHFAIRPGPQMAAADQYSIHVEGKGGHGAMPHHAIDTILVASQIVNNLQSIVARNVDPLKSAVVSVCAFNAGFTTNVIPQTATLLGTARSLLPDVRDLLEKRIIEITTATAAVHGATAICNYERGYPPTVNHADETAIAVGIAREIAGEPNVNPEVAPVMGAEDFAYMLEQRPGAYIMVGNGDTAMCHHPAYDFADAAIPAGTSYWVRLVERQMAV
jgi:amidohydrolase